MKRTLLYSLVVMFSGTSVSTSLAQLTIIEEIGNPNAPLAKYSRFEGGSSFIGAAHDFSGVGKTTVSVPYVDALMDHGALISASFHLAAKHSNRHPTAGETMRFYDPGVGPNDDLENSNNFEEHDVDQSWTVGGDLQAGKNSSPVSNNIAVYPILLFQDLSDYNNLETLVFGKARGNTFAQRHDRVARSIIQSASTSDTISFKAAVRTEDGYPIPGDSGSPSFATEVYLAWGPLYIGSHWGSRVDSSVTTAGRRDKLRSDMLARQPNVPVHLQEVPTFWTGILGDYDGSFDINAADLDIMLREVNMNGARGYNWYLDLDSDGDIDDDDAEFALGPFVMDVKWGDINLDGSVDNSDFLILSANFTGSSSNGGKGWAEGDFDGDGDVDFTDFLVLSNNFGS